MAGVLRAPAGVRQRRSPLNASGHFSFTSFVARAGMYPSAEYFLNNIFPCPLRQKRTNGPVPTRRENCFPRGHTMTEDRRFMTYTRLEKAYQRILARRMLARQKRRKLQTQHRKIVEAVGATAWIGKRQSDSLTPLRPMTVEGQAQARPVSHSHTLERIIA
jgi:hypothetical protein